MSVDQLKNTLDGYTKIVHQRFFDEGKTVRLFPDHTFMPEGLGEYFYGQCARVSAQIIGLAEEGIAMFPMEGKLPNGSAFNNHVILFGYHPSWEGKIIAYDPTISQLPYIARKGDWSHAYADWKDTISEIWYGDANNPAALRRTLESTLPGVWDVEGTLREWNRKLAEYAEYQASLQNQEPSPSSLNRRTPWWRKILGNIAG